MKVSVSFNVQGLKTGIKLDDETKRLVATFQFQAEVHPADIARVLQLQTICAPMTCTINSNQAELDLRIEQVDKNGEIVAIPNRLVGSVPDTEE